MQPLLGSPRFQQLYRRWLMDGDLIGTAGGLSADRTRWIRPKTPAFLVPVRARSVIVRAKMSAARHRAGLLDQIPAASAPSDPPPGSQLAPSATQAPSG